MAPIVQFSNEYFAPTENAATQKKPESEQSITQAPTPIVEEAKEPLPAPTGEPTNVNPVYSKKWGAPKK